MEKRGYKGGSFYAGAFWDFILLTKIQDPVDQF